jgi:predicted RNA-binding Zn-ribbon protein involved in translation (DUF1610 family)
MKTIDQTSDVLPADLPLEQMMKTYANTFYCKNCGHKNHRRIKKGVRVPKSVTCENCGCSTD